MARGRMKGAPNETKIHSQRFANKRLDYKEVPTHTHIYKCACELHTGKICRRGLEHAEGILWYGVE